MNRLVIGTVTAQKTPDDVTLQPDDRQELVKTVTYADGAFLADVAVVDGGYAGSGVIMSCSGVQFAASDWATIEGYWSQRTRVAVTGLDGVTVNAARIVLKSWTHNKRFGSITADLEVWRV